MEVWRLFWAKTNREKIEGLPEDWTHPLWAHLIDVGSAAQVLWEQFLPQSLKQNMADGIGMSLADAGKFLSVWIGLHDLGKGTPNFQGMHEPSKQRQLQAGFIYHERPNRLHHGHASIAIVWNWLRSKNLPHDTLLDATAACVGIHHGKLCQSDCWESVAEDTSLNAVLGNTMWKQAQQELAESVFTAWGAEWPNLDQFDSIGTAKNPWPDWLMAFAGWTTLADWLGSMQRCYDIHVQATDTLSDYIASSREGALLAYETAGLNQQANLRALPFSDHFGFPPRPLQTIVCKLPLRTDAPNLVIVEAPTGEGKTEAAFYLTARVGGGIYIAMPSQSTSDGLFPRMGSFIQGDPKKHLAAAHDGETAALRLVHGNDLLNEDALSLLEIDKNTALVNDPAPGDESDQPDAHAKSRLLSWFMPKKRALLVPYGVGTVDQLFLGVLHARHFFLRLFALVGKTVVFDEVHAYDTYMNTLFIQLLRWLHALDVNVVVLSATLPSATRAQIMSAWDGIDPTPADKEAPYPITWHVTGGKVTDNPFDPTPDREQHLAIQWCDDSVETIVAQARFLLEQDATVLVICNKVDRAQAIFAALDDDTLLLEADRMLLHARMPQAWRKEREKAALNRFGKDRPARRGLLVGTQVIEQSLDLDADAMITDLAPVDLLLQRAGRLHRHQRDDRPARFSKPILYVACAAADDNELPDVDTISGGGHIYGRALLWKTRAVLRLWGGWALPLGDGFRPGYRKLVEAVYGDLLTPPVALAEVAQQTYGENVAAWTEGNKVDGSEAQKRLVPAPRKLASLFVFEKSELHEEDESTTKPIPQHLMAATRNPDSINAEVLLLYRTEKGWSTESDGPTVLFRNRKGYLTTDIIRTVFGASVRLSQPGIVAALWKTDNSEWKAIQQQYRLLQRFHLVELVNHRATIANKSLRLNERLGLEID